jgi:hypothetical protein
MNLKAAEHAASDSHFSRIDQGGTIPSYEEMIAVNVTIVQLSVSVNMKRILGCVSTDDWNFHSELITVGG